MKPLKYAAILSALVLLAPLGALARDKNQHSIDISDPTQVGGTELKPGITSWSGKATVQLCK